MDFNIMVCIIGLCHALQRHCGDHLLFLGAKDFGQGTQRSTSIEERIEVMVGETE
jgi:hypothetical protein